MSPSNSFEALRIFISFLSSFIAVCWKVKYTAGAAAAAVDDDAEHT